MYKAPTRRSKEVNINCLVLIEILALKINVKTNVPTLKHNVKTNVKNSSTDRIL